jgi:hypothetical protein
MPVGLEMLFHKFFGEPDSEHPLSNKFPIHLKAERL